MKSPRFLLAIPIATSVIPSAAAQTAVRGRVVDRAGNPVAQAEVILAGGGGVVTRTNADGRYLLGIGPQGLVTITVRALGFASVSRDIGLDARDTAIVEFRLERTSQQLAPLIVDAPAEPPVSAKMRGFEERRRAGFGQFLTREILGARESSVLSDLLAMTPGLRFVRRPSPCGGGFAVATGRGGHVNPLPWMRCESPPGVRFPPACYLAIYQDGVRIWHPGQVEPPRLDDLITVASLQGVEIYRGPSETPIQFQGTGNSCGAILLWTRTGES